MDSNLANMLVLGNIYKRCLVTSILIEPFRFGLRSTPLSGSDVYHVTLLNGPPNMDISVDIAVISLLIVWRTVYCQGTPFV